MASGQNHRKTVNKLLKGSPASAPRLRGEMTRGMASRNSFTNDETSAKPKNENNFERNNNSQIVKIRPTASTSGRERGNNLARPAASSKLNLQGEGTQNRMISPRLPGATAYKSRPTGTTPRPLMVDMAKGKDVPKATDMMHISSQRQIRGPVAKKQIAPRKGQGKQVSRVGSQGGVVLGRSTMSPRNYTVKPIIPAQTAELIDVARAMHRDQFATRVKKLFDPEREAALQAIETGIYVGWRCLGNNWDCIRVSTKSKCFCGHLLADHAAFSERRRQNLECRTPGCGCKQFAFIPSRPEDIGEWWLQKRPGFDVSAWRAKCRCKHTHEEHNPNANRRCKVRGCPCFAFDSNFLCAACDKHWEEHETCFDDIDSRREKDLPYGEEYLPFHELPQLRNIVLTGNEDDDSPYNELTSGPYAIPRQKPTDLALRLQGMKKT